MAENTKIEWCDATFNPWVGCQKVSPGCDHCYAEGWAKRSGQVQWGPHGERKRTSKANWRKPITWHNQAPEFMQYNDRLRRVFCASLSDVFDNQVPTQWRTDLFDLIASTPRMNWLLLTKRPENLVRMFPTGEWRNIWLGTTCEDQEHFDKRWPLLWDMRVPVKFISYEPALGPLMLPSSWTPAALPDWIICGGESGPGARTMDPNWARDLRDVCKSTGIAFFFKQMTKKAPIPADLQIREFPR